MAKRVRNELAFDSLRSVLGDIPESTCEALLHKTNNNVEEAIELYFTNPTSIVTAKKAKPIRFNIGEIVITGWSLYAGKSPVQEGDKIEIIKDKKITDTSNRIVRFNCNGATIGRLPKEIANYISVLIDLDICQFEGSVVWSPPQLKIGEDIILTIQCFVLTSAMKVDSFMNEFNPSKRKKQIGDDLDEIKTLRKTSLIQMFRNLGINPVRSTIRDTLGGDSSWDAMLQSVNTKEEAPMEEEEDLQGPDEEGNKEVSDDQLNTIYEKSRIFDDHITPMQQPDTLSIQLKEYQQRALTWMTRKEALHQDEYDIDMRAMHPLWEEYCFPNKESEYTFFYFNPYTGELSLEFPEANSQERGGILADEMGLGKTIEMLSLMHCNRYKKGEEIPRSGSIKNSPTSVVVCPVSLLAQWRDEIIKGSKPGTIKVEVYYGDDRSATLAKRLCKWDGSAPDVLVTTYGTLMNEWCQLDKGVPEKTALYNIDFWRVILDEAHQIKNPASKTAQACRDIRATRRWAVTGTPIQNKLDDLYSLIRFLKHEPWANRSFWKTFITIPFEKKDPAAISAVQTVLEPIVLRRTKNMKDSRGQPMVLLPSKTIGVEYLAFSPEEQDIYDAVYSDSETKFSYFCQAGQLGKNYASIFQLLIRLRQICCHPYLMLQNAYKTGTKEIKSEGQDVLLENLIAGHYKKPFSPSENNEHTYRLSVLQNLLSMQQNGISATDSVTKAITENSLPAVPDECPICFESPDSMIAMPCMHMACRPCVMDYFQKKENKGLPGDCPLCRAGPILPNQLLEIAQERDKTQDTQRIDVRKAVGGYKPSTKIRALIKLLHQYQQEGHKTVVFSQFTSFLDLIGEALDYEKIDFTRLDGSHSQAQREKVLSTFSKVDANGIAVLLISLRAGGVGLNLTCASRVVMMDPWWNFAIEAQAIDRVHRLGQLKNVEVTRFVMKGTVEERILEIQDSKHTLANNLYTSRDESKNRKMHELKLLFSKK
ncbi:SNF2 family N-terminal domain-containing protein [Sporodiniella umbellata]|nr:SNF2 family N-terminal domain-containing protein [Sporodiniella umbellata]